MQVRFFAYSGYQGTSLKQPYLARQGVEANMHLAEFTAPELTAHTATKFVRVEFEKGSVVAIECNPPNRNAAADALSPRYEGSATFEAGPGWTFSALEIA
jgi:argininosuccinate synthase